MSVNSLPELAKLALEAPNTSSHEQALVQATDLVRRQTGAVSALLFYGDGEAFAGCGVGDSPASYSSNALRYLQQRLIQLRVPLAFAFVDGELRYLTRAANKQPREYFAWLVPVTSSWTELLILRGAWPPNAVQSLLDAVDSALPALTIITERFLGTGRNQQFERQLTAIDRCVDYLRQSAAVIGSYSAVSSTFGQMPSEQLSLLQQLAAAASDSIGEAKAGRDLLEAHLRLQEHATRLERAVQIERQNATTDSLTGLLNGRGAHEALHASIDAATVEGKPVSVLLGDVDGFKLFNDTYGHIKGDEVLRLVADIFTRVCGNAGIAARYAGDEFLVILPNLGKQEAIELAQTVVEQLGQTEFQAAAGRFIPISMSIGVATYPEDSTSISSLIAIADSSMYAAKRQVRRADVSVVSSVPETNFGVLEGLVMAIHAKDRYTKDHCDIVAEYAVKIAERLKLPEESKRALSIAGLLHDIGKLVIPDEILKKPGALTPDEYEVIKQHVRVGEALIREVPQLNEVQQAVSCHHERFDGSGYPRGLKGEEIPLLGRIIGVADTYSAMKLDRPYRKGLSTDRIIEVFIEGAGTQFDPDIARMFSDMLMQERATVLSNVA